MLWNWHWHIVRWIQLFNWWWWRWSQKLNLSVKTSTCHFSREGILGDVIFFYFCSLPQVVLNLFSNFLKPLNLSINNSRKLWRVAMNLLQCLHAKLQKPDQIKYSTMQHSTYVQDLGWYKFWSMRFLPRGFVLKPLSSRTINYSKVRDYLSSCFVNKSWQAVALKYLM